MQKRAEDSQTMQCMGCQKCCRPELRESCDVRFKVVPFLDKERFLHRKTEKKVGRLIWEVDGVWIKGRGSYYPGESHSIERKYKRMDSKS